MEPHQQQQQQNQQQEDGKGSGNFVCRQSSTRWTPTSEQIRILKDLYYNSGVRSPNAEEIQRITARLRPYGKIEGKNVFYWFQNHKARERQKKRLNADHVPMQRPSSCAWKSKDSFHSKYPNYTPGVSASSSSASVFPVGQIGEYGYGSVPMERSFRECSLSAGGTHHGSGGSMTHSLGWVGIDPYSSHHYSLFDKTKSKIEEEEHEEEAPEIETLPLFPMHDEALNNSHTFCNSKADESYWYHHSPSEHETNSRTSLELSLNSYSYSYMDHSRGFL